MKYNLLKTKDISFKLLMQSREVFFAMLASAMAMYNVTFFASFLAIVLQKKYGVADADMGFYFVVLSIPYLFAALAFPLIFSKFPRKLLFVLCFFFSSFAIGMMGPS